MKQSLRYRCHDTVDNEYQNIGDFKRDLEYQLSNLGVNIKSIDIYDGKNEIELKMKETASMLKNVSNITGTPQKQLLSDCRDFIKKSIEIKDVN